LHLTALQFPAAPMFVVRDTRTPRNQDEPWNSSLDVDESQAAVFLSLASLVGILRDVVAPSRNLILGLTRLLEELPLAPKT
jgi:hypothetical protein